MRYLLFAVMLFVAAACETAPWREQPPPWTYTTVRGAEEVLVVRYDGEVVVLRRARIEVAAGGSWLIGESNASELRLPLEDVASLETRRTETLRVIANTAIVAVAVAVVVAGAVCGGGGGLSGLSFGSSSGGGGGGHGTSQAPPRRPRPKSRAESPMEVR